MFTKSVMLVKNAVIKFESGEAAEREAQVDNCGSCNPWENLTVEACVAQGRGGAVGFQRARKLFHIASDAPVLLNNC
jgi:hypothetical protein